MAPPIDYSKWDDLDTNSDTDADTMSDKKVNDPIHESPARDAPLQTPDIEQPVKEKGGGCAMYDAEPKLMPQLPQESILNETILAIAGPVLEDDDSGGWDNAIWFTPTAALVRLTVMHNSPSFAGTNLYNLSLEQWRVLMTNMEAKMKIGRKTQLEQRHRLPHLEHRIHLNHGNDTKRKSRRLQGDVPEFRWKIPQYPRRHMIACMYNSSLLLPYAAQAGIRNLTLLELKAEWDVIINRIKKHLSQATSIVPATKLEAFVAYVSNMFQLQTKDLVHVLKAMEYATENHGDFAVYKDDFTILNDPHSIRFNLHGCRHTAKMIMMLAGPNHTKDFAPVHQLYDWKMAELGPTMSHGSFQRQDVAARIRAIHKRFEKGDDDGLAILTAAMFNLSQGDEEVGDVHSNIAHSFTLALGKQGVVILQSYRYRSLSSTLKEWIDQGHARLRTWDDFNTWIENFEWLMSYRGPFNRTLSIVWEKCFNMDMWKVCGGNDTEQFESGHWHPFVLSYELPHVQMQDIHKFNFKLGTYRDKEGWGGLAAYLAVNRTATPHDTIHVWTPFTREL